MSASTPAIEGVGKTEAVLGGTGIASLLGGTWLALGSPWAKADYQSHYQAINSPEAQEIVEGVRNGTIGEDESWKMLEALPGYKGEYIIDDMGWGFAILGIILITAALSTVTKNRV